MSFCFLSSRLRSSSESGYRFEDWRFLVEHEDFELLMILRRDTDRKIRSRLAATLDPPQLEQFLNQWKSVRKGQRQQSEATLGMIREDRS